MKAGGSVERPAGQGESSSGHAFAARWATRQLVKAKAERDRQLADLYAQLAAAHTDRHLHAPAEDRCAICRHEHPPYTRCCDLCHYKTFRLP